MLFMVEFLVVDGMVRATGFEPASFALKVRDPRPLDHARFSAAFLAVGAVANATHEVEV